jgi:hypothetical protein
MEHDPISQTCDAFTYDKFVSRLQTEDAVESSNCVQSAYRRGALLHQADECRLIPKKGYQDWLAANYAGGRTRASQDRLIYEYGFDGVREAHDFCVEHAADFGFDVHRPLKRGIARPSINRVVRELRIYAHYSQFSHDRGIRRGEREIREDSQTEEAEACADSGANSLLDHWPAS